MAILKKEKSEASNVSNFVPDEAISTSENARHDAQQSKKQVQAGDPYSEDRMSVKVPSKEEVQNILPDDTVNPG